MKVKFITLMFLTVTFISYSQTEDFCATPDEVDPVPSGVYSKSTDIGYLDSFNNKNFNIFYWRINKNDGSYTEGGEPLTPQKALQSVEVLNDAFMPLNICFNLIGMDTINSTAHHTGSSLSYIKQYAEDQNYRKQNAINVYVPHRLIKGSGAAAPLMTILAVNDVSVSGKTIIHELGHTFGYSNERPDPINCELVSGYNAEYAGDHVSDTNAVPNFLREQHNHVAYAVEAANILGYEVWLDARQIAFEEYGFNSLPESAAIEQALINYGFAEAEINHLKFNPAVKQAYSDTINCIYAPDSRIDDPNSPFFKTVRAHPIKF